MVLWAKTIDNAEISYAASYSSLILLLWFIVYRSHSSKEIQMMYSELQTNSEIFVDSLGLLLPIILILICTVLHKWFLTEYALYNALLCFRHSYYTDLLQYDLHVWPTNKCRWYFFCWTFIFISSNWILNFH